MADIVQKCTMEDVEMKEIFVMISDLSEITQQININACIEKCYQQIWTMKSMLISSIYITFVRIQNEFEYLRITIQKFFVNEI